MLDALLQATSAKVAFKDRDGIVLACSESYCAWCGKTKKT